MVDALYARQSVDKTDSISIESQLEYCKYEARGNPCQMYADRGYSGKNTNRPAFEELLSDIRQGKIARVIVYKLDRISRSILDFATMMEVFQAHQVEFISSTERFDTSTPIGRAMLNICIVFAQLERETIQKRVQDAYYSRSKKGFYMGGRIPYGFTKTETVLDGIKTSMYVPIPEEAAQIRLLYELYANSDYSLGGIVSYFYEHDIKHLRGGVWSTARISDMLRNPVYVKADADAYAFFKSQGANIINPISDFTGSHACYLYQGTASSTRKQSDLTGKELVLAPHQGIVASKDWIACRKRCLGNRQSTKTCKSKNSWLSGKVKCGICGHSLTIAKANTRWRRYFICSAALATKKAACKGVGGTVYATVLETYVEGQIHALLSTFETLSCQEESPVPPQTNETKLQILVAEQEIEALLSKVSSANSVLLTYINQKIETLDLEKKRLQKAAEADALPSDRHSFHTIKNHPALWKHVSFQDKQTIADLLIKSISIANGKIEITWNL